MIKLLYFLGLIYFAGCSSLATKKNYTLRFLGDIAFEQGATFEGIPFGGISGLAFDKRSRELIAVSDDRGEYGPARLYHLGLELSKSHFTVKILKMISLKSAHSKNFKKDEVDFEGVVLTPSNKLIISSEGDSQTSPRIPPSIMIFDRTGSYNGWVNIPEHFIPEHKGVQTRGPRENAAFESLALTKDGDYLFSATEDSMLQDGDRASLSKGSTVRLMRFEKSKKTYKFENEYAYPLSKIPSIPGRSKTKGSTGLVEIVALDKNNLFIMERAWTPENKKQSIRLYKVEILPNSTSLNDSSDLKKDHFIPVKKTLIANLDDFVPLLKEGDKRLDNFEGMTLGPKLKNGNHTLLMVSDDNFSKHQRTILLAFEIL